MDLRVSKCQFVRTYRAKKEEGTDARSYSPSNNSGHIQTFSDSIQIPQRSINGPSCSVQVFFAFSRRTTFAESHCQRITRRSTAISETLKPAGNSFGVGSRALQLRPAFCRFAPCHKVIAGRSQISTRRPNNRCQGTCGGEVDVQDSGSAAIGPRTCNTAFFAIRKQPASLST
jgi:hypothetical protein